MYFKAQVRKWIQTNRVELTFIIIQNYSQGCLRRIFLFDKADLSTIFPVKHLLMRKDYLASALTFLNPLFPSITIDCSFWWNHKHIYILSNRNTDVQYFRTIVTHFREQYTLLIDYHVIDFAVGYGWPRT